MRGYRVIRAHLLRRYAIRVSRKTVNRVMRELGLTQPKMRRKPLRPKRVERMRPSHPDQACVKPPVVWTLSWVYSGGLPGGR